MKISRGWWGVVAMIPLLQGQLGCYSASAPELSAASTQEEAGLPGFDATARLLSTVNDLDDDAWSGVSLVESLIDGQPHNNLSPEALKLNALTTNTDPQILGFLTTHSLEEVMTNPTMRVQLHDPNAQKVMKYIASCALGSQDTVTYNDPFVASTTTSWPGQVGLCGSWLHTPPGGVCLELVSACVLSLVNGLNRRVVVSFRGKAGELPPLHDRVRVEQTYRENGGTPIHSFAPCKGKVNSGPPNSDPLNIGPQRNCGFTPLYVGRCVAKNQITVGAGAGKLGCNGPLFGEHGDNMVLRVCKGIYGCDDPSSPGDSDPYSYNGFIGTGLDTCGTAPSVTFECPEKGYYSVMIGPRYTSDPNAPSAASVTVKASNNGYPATEAQVFTFREGGYYGNLFKLASSVTTQYVDTKGNIIKNPSTTTGKPSYLTYKDMYACYSSPSDMAPASMNDRICALAGSQCFVNPTKLCSPVSSEGQCESSNVNTWAYGQCRGATASPPWLLPITVYLNDPCDLSYTCQAALPTALPLSGAEQTGASPRRQEPSHQPPTTPR